MAARLAEVELPPMTDYRARVETLVSGISCGTESDAVSGRAHYMQRPILLGYQAVGRVVEIGNRVSGLRAGDIVVTGGGGLWSMNHMFGGSHARESVCEATQLIKLQADPSLFATASYAYLGAVAREGIARMKLEPGRVLLVMGLGMLGQLAGKIAQLHGLRVIGVNRSAWKRDAARAFGFDAVCAPETGEIQAAAEALGFGPVKYAFETTGNQQIMDLSLSCLAPYGELSLGGYYPPQGYRIDWDFCHSRNLSVHNPVGWGGQAPDYVRFVDEGRLNVETLIRHRVRPEEISQFYGDLVQNHSNYLGAVIEWRSEPEALSL